MPKASFIGLVFIDKASVDIYDEDDPKRRRLFGKRRSSIVGAVEQLAHSKLSPMPAAGATAGEVSDMILARRTPAAGQMMSLRKEQPETTAILANLMPGCDWYFGSGCHDVLVDWCPMFKLRYLFCHWADHCGEEMFRRCLEGTPARVRPSALADPEADVPKNATGEQANGPLPNPRSMKTAKTPLPKPLPMKKQLGAKKMPKRGKYRIAAKAVPVACNPPFFRQHVRQGALCPQCEADIQGRAWHRQEESLEAERVD